MRRFLAVVLFCLSLPVAAQGKPPADLQPLPEPPPMPPGAADADQAMEPQVTIHHRGKETVEEYRMGGRLYMIKVTPAGGKPYYLIDERGDGTFTRHNNYDTGTRPPMWVILQF